MSLLLTCMLGIEVLCLSFLKFFECPFEYIKSLLLLLVCVRWRQRILEEVLVITVDDAYDVYGTILNKLELFVDV